MLKTLICYLRMKGTGFSTEKQTLEDDYMPKYRKHEKRKKKTEEAEIREKFELRFWYETRPQGP